MKLLFRLPLWFCLLGTMSVALPARADPGTVYWMSPRSGTVIDRQVAAEIGKRADVVIVGAGGKELGAIVARLKESTRKPVLSYAWATRFPEKGRVEADIFRGLDYGNPVAGFKDAANGNVEFLDVTNPELRSRIVGRLMAAKRDLGVDGFALDLSTRTPLTRPAPLAKRCQQEAAFCDRYANGVDALFADLRRALGSNGMFVYNGLYNFRPGQIQDQARLLASADSAAIEYFGLDPNEKTHSFTHDIQPFLQAIPTLPPNKSVMFFGRGPWAYSSYAEDYRWQRYLYASFLLAARDNDLFQYLATFQVPSTKGRAGGLAYYSDWNVKLGAARGPASSGHGLYMREFAGGMVVVSPDDGQGGVIGLTRTFFTPEGESLQGNVRLATGDSLILLNSRLDRPARHEVKAATMAGWRWSNATLAGTSLQLQPLPANQVGEHDLLLDYERSSLPYDRLEIDARLAGSGAMLAVAEVDDPKKEYMYVMFAIGGNARGAGMTLAEPAPFRSAAVKSRGDLWPMLTDDRLPAQGPLVLDGSKLLEGSGYEFRRWTHLRLLGPLSISQVALSAPKAMPARGAGPR
ncbi:MAG: putative glycoside hydrolase [Caldimonas sp.]